MGCTSSSSQKGLSQDGTSKSVEIPGSSQVTSTPALSTRTQIDPPTSPLNSSARKLPPCFQIDKTKARHLCQTWIETFSISTADAPITDQDVFKDVQSLLNTWPRGNEAGQLLPIPIASPTSSLASRGVKTSWLFAAWNHMTSSTQKNLCSTRMFVELLLRPLLAETDHTECFFDFIPLAFRTEHPFVFVCHPWDGYLRHLLFYPDNVKRSWPADCGVWLDIFALPQLDEGPNSDMLIEVHTVVNHIANTLAVFPGDGSPEFALLPLVRSWCVFEMLATPKDCLSYKMGIHGDLNDSDFHNGLVSFIDDVLNVNKATASFFSDQTAIRTWLKELPGDEDALDHQMRHFARAALQKRYSGVPVTVAMLNRISSSRGRRISSISEVYINPSEVGAPIISEKKPSF